MDKIKQIFSIHRIKQYLINIVGISAVIFIASIITYRGGTYFFKDNAIIRVPDNTTYKMHLGIGKGGIDTITFIIGNTQFYSYCSDESYLEIVCNRKYRNRSYVGSNVVFAPSYKVRNHVFGFIKSGYLYDKNSQYKKYLSVNDQYIKKRKKHDFYSAKIVDSMPFVSLFIALFFSFPLYLLRNIKE